MYATLNYRSYIRTGFQATEANQPSGNTVYYNAMSATTPPDPGPVSPPQPQSSEDEGSYTTEKAPAEDVSYDYIVMQ